MKFPFFHITFDLFVFNIQHFVFNIQFECVILETVGVPSIFCVIRSAAALGKPAALSRMLPTFDLSCEETPRGGSGTGQLKKLFYCLL
jgi:hypothetical protein